MESHSFIKYECLVDFAHLHRVIHGLRRPLDEGELVLQLPLVSPVLLVVRVSASALRLALLFSLLLSLQELKEDKLRV